jgi:hypothetical protein
MKTFFVGATLFLGMGLQAQAVPDTAGKLAVGAQSNFGLSTSKIISGPGRRLSDTVLGDDLKSDLFALRYGISQDLFITGFAGLHLSYLNIEQKSESSIYSANYLTQIELGSQIDYVFAHFENSRLSAGFAVFVEGLGQHHRYENEKSFNSDNVEVQEMPWGVSLVPSLNYEYFLLPNLSVNGSFSIPITFSATSSSSGSTDYQSTLVALTTAFRPFIGAYYYF